MAMIDPPKTPNETSKNYFTRRTRWQNWLSQEPLVDLYYIEETEIQEYRTWAGTKKWHDQIVKELMELTNERS